VSSKLSINMGLRNDSITAWKERHNGYPICASQWRHFGSGGNSALEGDRFQDGSLPCS